MQELEHVVRQLKALNDYPDRDGKASQTSVLERKEPVVTMVKKKEIPPLRTRPLSEDVEAADKAMPIPPMPPLTAEHKRPPVEPLSVPTRRPIAPGRKLFAEGPNGPGGGGGGGSQPPGGNSGERDRRGGAGWMNWLGAMAAILLVGLVGLWTYKLGQREAMEVPIVRALEGPNRVQPDDPGGTTMAHQGLSVNEVLNGGGVAGVAQTVRTAPGDETVQPEDRPGRELIGLAEAQKPLGRPLPVTVGVDAPTTERAAVAIDDVMAMAHSRLDEAGTAPDPADAAAAERAAMDAIVSAIANDSEVIETPEGEALTAAVEETEASVTERLEAARTDTVAALSQEVVSADVPLAVEQETDGAALWVGQDENPATGVEAVEPSDTVVAEVAPEPIPETAPQAETQLPAQQLAEPLVIGPVGAPQRDAATGARIAIADLIEAAPRMDASDAPQVDLSTPQRVASVGPVPPQGEGSSYAPVSLPQPRARPSDLATQMRIAVDEAVAVIGVTPAEEPAAAAQPASQPVQLAAATGALDVIPLPVGTRMIQIGAFDSEAIARQQWDRFSSLHPDLLWGKEPFVQRTNNSGRIFYRLRVAGYTTKEETRAACAELDARGLPCMSVTLR